MKNIKLWLYLRDQSGWGWWILPNNGTVPTFTRQKGNEHSLLAKTFRLIMINVS